jgi:uncharacterized membrane protein YfbV (UPF0208 family)
MSQGVAIIAAATALVTLLLAIFGASWLNQRNIENLLLQWGKRVDARFDQLDARLDTLLTEIKRPDQRIDSLTQRVDRIQNPSLPPRA